MKRSWKSAGAALMLLLCLTLSLSLSLFGCEQKEDGEPMYVTIANGDLLCSYAPVHVTDLDEDGALTINDALMAAHAKYYDKGTDGYASAQTEYGLSLTKLWGDTSGSFGYTLNNQTVMTSLAEPVKAGDHIYAYVYTDQVTYSDTFCYFDQTTATVAKGGTLTLTLTGTGYDENWSPIAVPVAGAKIFLDGTDTGVVTDAEGKATITITGSKTVVITAKSDSQTLVPPVCSVTIQ